MSQPLGKLTSIMNGMNFTVEQYIIATFLESNFNIKNVELIYKQGNNANLVEFGIYDAKKLYFVLEATVMGIFHPFDENNLPFNVGSINNTINMPLEIIGNLTDTLTVESNTQNINMFVIKNMFFSRNLYNGQFVNFIGFRLTLE